jgi:1-pyrroline-5-carboxylate dehydrogenase
MPKSNFENESTYKKFADSGKEQEFDNLFESAVAEVKKGFGATHPMCIGGKEVYTNETLTEKSPIDSNIIIGKFQKGNREHARQAIAAAQKAFATWSELGYKERANLFRKAADTFSKEKFRLSAMLSYENGKSRYESIGEVDEAIDFMRYYANEIQINKGYLRKTSSKPDVAKVGAGFQGAPSAAESVTISMKPYGVFGVLAPFNFPISLSMGMSSAAMITGNTVVFKPSSTDNMSMLTGLKIYELLKQAGLPDGVFNYITGPGSVIGEELISNDGVAGIAFTGSRSTGMSMISSGFSAGKQKIFVVEMGGKNPTIVSKFANLDDAVSGITSAAFGFSGQKCSCTSRVYVHESIKEQFVSKLIEKARTLKIGNPLEKDVYMGPLISESAHRRYTESIERARSTGRVLYGGNTVKPGLNGFYVEPAIIEVRHESELVHKELFVPILTIESFKSIDEAIDLANDVEYGLTAALYSSKSREIKEFSKRIQAGVVYINRSVSATTGAIVGLHTFVGWKGSSLTGKGTGSKHYLEQFLREQSMSIVK